MLRFPTSEKVGSAWERFCRTLFGDERSGSRKLKARRLVIDQLEERELLSVSPTGAETKVNTTVAGAALLGNADRCTAMNDAGDFVVVWTGADADGRGVYMRMYNSDGTPRTGETLVNTYTAGNQYQCSVGMDADGDFVVAWNSAAQESNGTSGIYAQRFNSMGTKLGSELHVNTNQANMQSVPSVAMDCFGDFAVVWANTGQDFSWYNDIRGQMFGTDGNRLGSEFLVNSRNVPGASGEEIAPSVAISDSSTHHIVVGWESATGEKNGAATNAVAMARLFSWDGTGVHAVAINGSDAQFQAEVGTDKFIGDAEHVESVRLTPRWDSSNVQVAMDPTGQFVVTWESYHDNDIVTTSPPDQIDSWGIYYRVFNANGTPQTTLDCQANQVVTCQPTDPTWVRPDWLLTQDESDQWAGNQLRSSVSMDADGDFTITWDGNGANSSSPLSPHNTFYGHDAAGVWYRRFHSTQTGYTATPAVCTQTRVNTTSAGTQIGSTITENRSGDYVVTWSVGNDVYFQRYTESTDTAGAILTDFLLPDGSSVASTSQVTQGLQAIVLTFDEAMYDNAAHTGSAVTNPKNYWLVYNGANVQGGISQVYYGYDIANTLGSQYGLNMPKVDKYQVVLVVDSNGAGAGVQALIDGQYQVAVTNALRDAAGNALNSVGPGPNGGLASGLINVSIPTGQETKVANGTTPSGATYGKYTYATTADPVASDSQGDYVVAWTDTTPGHEGVWVKMYTQTSTLNPAPTGRTTSVAEYPAINPATGSPWTNNEIRVSSDATASDISVARDVNGDFVVTWSAWNATTNWDVYAQRYSATGQPVGSAFRVNSTTAEVQRSSSVAMDAQGDFVITWQSENQDGGGYGVYAQAYNSAGQIVGGTDEIQAIDFTGGFTGTFVLRWDDDNDQFTPDKVTAPITFTGNASASLTGIENALKAIGANVKCVANGLSQVLVEFVDASGNADQQPLWIAPSDIVRTGGTASATVTTSTIVAGKFGEFRVNDTTVGDQVAPDVAMDSKGDFVITWTTFGQGSDSAGESDIYAKRYASSSLDWYPEDITSVASGLAYSGNLSNAVLHPDLSTVDNPYAHVVSAGTGYDGIGEILGDDFGDEFIGTGSLLSGTNWVLTAGHCAWSEKYNVPLVPGQLSVAFDLPAGRVVVPVTQVVVNPSFAGTANFLLGGDLALLQLAFVPVGVQGLAIYTGTDEIGKTYDIYGYGAFGTGSVGQVFDSDNVKRHGQNVFDATGAVLGYSDKQLAADFDDGTNQHDAFGSLYGIHNTDSALIANHQEAISCQGDSGGPLIIDGKIAAITSGSATLTQPPVDVDSSLDSTYGEFSIDTRISSFADWIQNVTNCLGQSEFLVNQNDIVANTGNVDSLGNPIFYALDNESGNQCDSSVAMDSAGDFVITWTSYNHDGVGNGYGAGVNGENGVFARRYNANSTAASSVFQVNQSVTGNQQNANVAMDDAGDFVITWESSNGIDTGTGIESFDIYARRYARTSLVGYTQGQIGAVPLLWSGTNSVYSVDPLFIKAVVLSDTDQVVQLAGTGNLSFNNGAIGGEVLVNSTTAGDQRFPGVAIDATGDAVVVWSGNGQQAGQQDPQGIFYQRLAMASDTAGPEVGQVYNEDVADNGTVTTTLVPEASVLAAGPNYFLVAFSEALSTANGSSGAHSILNLANWQLAKSGVAMPKGIVNVQYGLNEAYVLGYASTPSNKYEAVVTFDSDAGSSDNQALQAGSYTLTIRSAVQDLFGNALDGGYTGAASDFSRAFTVLATGDNGDNGGSTGGDTGNITAPGNPTAGSSDTAVNTYHTTLNGTTTDVAMDANGDYVIIWESNHYADGGDISFQRYNQYGQAQGLEGTANAHTKTTDPNGTIVYRANGVQVQGAVAMDSFGDFVIVWSGSSTLTGTTADDTADDTGIYAQIFDKNGKAVGNQIAINQTLQGVQNMPKVAMDTNGDFVVTWTSYAMDGTGQNVLARRFSVQGLALSDEFMVNTTTLNAQKDSDVAMDSSGDFVIVWQSFGQDGSDWGVYGQRYNTSGAKVGGEFQVNTVTADKQVTPAVAMDSTGDFVVSYASVGQNGVASGYDIYARRYSAAGVALDANAFLVNKTISGWQVQPDVSMAANGNFVVTWSSFGQDNAGGNVANPTQDYGIYARMYNANGTDGASPSGAIPGEFRINAITAGDQSGDAVAMAPGGKTFAVAWEGPVNYSVLSVPASDMEVFTRLVDPVVSAGPKIGSIAVAPDSGVMSWNAADSDGVASAKLTIDGVSVSKLYGPYAAASGFNFSAAFGKLAAGTHTYVITAVDKAGNISTREGTFKTTTPVTPVNSGPTISGVVVVDSGIISWHAVDSDGVKSGTLAVDGANVTTIYGPSVSGDGVNFSGVFGKLAAGDHTYVITTTDKLGNVTTGASTTFTVAGSGGTNAGPTVSGVVVVPDSGIISWHAVDSDGVKSAMLTVDGTRVTTMYGPSPAGDGVNFSGLFGKLAAGNHTYVITTTDKLGNVTTTPSATFTVDGGATNAGPTINSIVVLGSSGIISWHATDSDGVRGATLAVDDANVSRMYGPSAAGDGVNFSGVFGSLASGNHSYLITTTDKLGNSSTSSGTFSVSGSSGGGSVVNSAVRSAVLRSASASSAKVDWLYDLPSLTSATAKATSDDTTDAIDAVLAAY